MKTATNEIQLFVSSIDSKFENSECNLTNNKLEFIHLVQSVEEKFNITIDDKDLNAITNVQELIEHTIQVIEK